MLAGLAAQSLTVGASPASLGFAVAAVVFVSLLVTASVLVSTVSRESLRPVRMTGHAVRRWSGFVLIAVGIWFVVLALLPGPILVG